MGAMPSIPWIIALLLAGWLVLPQLVALVLGLTSGLGNKAA